MNIRFLLSKQACLYPRNAALVFNEENYTFLELKNFSFRLANYFLARKIRAEDKIAVFLPNIPEAIISFLGVFSIGSVLVPLDFMLTEEEVIHFLNHCQAKILITVPKQEINLAHIKNSCPYLKEIILCKKKIEPLSFWPEVLAEGDSNESGIDIDENKLSSIFYTSGSTGRPKGVMLTYKNFDSPINCISHYLDLSFNDVLLCGGLPFSHLGGLDYILLMLYYSQKLVLMERFHPWGFLNNIEQYKVSLFWTVPAMYIGVVSTKEFDTVDLSSLRYAVVFGAPSSPALLKRFHKVCPDAHLINGWGMTETSAPNCFLPPGISGIESVGKFAPGMKAKVVDEYGNSLPPEAQGELLVAGEGIMKGYYEDEPMTKEVMTADGWLKTGDIAKFDAQGLCYIVGRKKDMIKVAGEMVFSSEVEEKIARHPAVKEAAVIGVFDQLRGEAPKAFLVLNEGKQIDLQELKNYLREHLAHFKIPRYFEVVRELPKNRVGKIDKQILSNMKIAEAGIVSARNNPKEKML